MENQKTLKAQEEKFKIEEIIAITSERGMKSVNSSQVREKLYEALKNSTEYKYDENKTLPENIYAAFPQYKLRELTIKYRTEMNSWKNPDLFSIAVDPAKRVRFAASRYMIPEELTIKVKKEKTEENSKTKGPSQYDIKRRFFTFGQCE